MREEFLKGGCKGGGRRACSGSTAGIAGICDASGLVFGLMPHPERFTRWTQHPRWTRLDPAPLATTPFGLAIFRNAVARARRQVAAA